LLVEKFGYLEIDVFVEEFVDQFDDAGLRLYLLRRRFLAHDGERLDFAALEFVVGILAPISQVWPTYQRTKSAAMSWV
jgi:hypothetical protein